MRDKKMFRIVVAALVFCVLAIIGLVVAAYKVDEVERHRAARGTASASPSPAPSPEPDCHEEINGYCYGFSTYYVAMRRDVPRTWGNARTWYANAQRDGYKVGTAPKKGAIAWTDVGPWGDVAYVEDVTADGSKVRVSSMNYNGNWNKVTYRVVVPTAYKGYIY